MDPLSFTASLFTVIAAAQGAVKAIQKLTDYRKSPRELLAFVSELASVQALLKDIVCFVELNPHALYSQSLFDCVQRASSKLTEINNLLASTPFNISKLNNARQAQLVWVLHKQRLVTLRADIRIIKTDLAVRLDLASVCSLHRLGDTLNVSISAQNRVNKQLASILERTPRNVGQSQSTPVTNASLSPARDACETLSSHPESSSQTPLALPALETSSAETSSLSTASAVTFRSPETSVNKCDAWCSCVCHIRTSYRSPWVFKSLMGDVSVSYGIQQPDCNEHSCRRLVTSSFCLVYQLPRYLMSRYFAMTMQFSPSNGPQLSLRMPRVMDWTHLLWNYARIGNLIAIQKMFAEGRASPYDVNPHGSNALIYAVGHRPNIVRFLVQQGAEPDLPNQAGRTASEMFWEHSFAGRLGFEGASTLGSFFEDGDYVQTRRFTTLHKIVLGIIHRDLGAELELSTAGIDARDARGRTPLCWAVVRNDLSAVRILLTFGAKPNILDDLGHTPLHFVRSVGICKLLLDAKVDVHARNAYYGRTALHPYGGGTREIKVVDMLVQAGIDVDARDADGETPLMSAIYYPLTPMAHRLLELGANVNATNWSNRYSPLHFAAEFDEHTIMPALLEKGADYTAQNKYGRTIAHLAGRYAGTQTLSILVKANLDRIDVTLRDKGGKTAAEYLSERCISLDIDQGVRDEFHKLLELRTHSKQCQLREHPRHPELRVSQDPDKENHLPGAYPLHDDY